MSQLLKKAIPILLAVLLLAYALKDVSVAEIGEQFRRSDYAYIFFCSLSILAFYIVRGIRWQQPLLALGYRPTAFRATVALMTGTVASMIFPGVGELARCATLQRTDEVPIAQGLGSVVAERIIDLFMLGVLLVVTLLVEFRRMTTYLAGLHIPLLNSDVSRRPWLIGLAIGIVLGVILVIRLSRGSTGLVSRVYERLSAVGRGLWRGFMGVRSLPNPGLFIGLTLLSQVLAWSSTYLLLLSVATDKALTPSMGLMILTVGSIGGLAVPTQAGIGTYHFLVGRALLLYGFSASQGIIMATFMHAVGFAINVLFSGISFLIVPFLTKQPRKPAEAMSES